MPGPAEFLFCLLRVNLLPHKWDWKLNRRFKTNVLHIRPKNGVTGTKDRDERWKKIKQNASKCVYNVSTPSQRTATTSSYFAFGIRNTAPDRQTWSSKEKEINNFPFWRAVCSIWKAKGFLGLERQSRRRTRGKYLFCLFVINKRICFPSLLFSIFGLQKPVSGSGSQFTKNPGSRLD